MKSPLFAAALFLGLLPLPLFAGTAGRERLNFNQGWRFHLGDPAEAADGQLDYSRIKDFILATGNDLTKAARVARPPGNPGADVSFVKPGFDDSGWRQLDLPHDWAIEGPFDINAPGEMGKLPSFQKGWYRKRFTLPAGDAGREVSLEIDGAMSYSTVWINGRLAGGWPYGYSSYRLDLTPYLNFGAENVVSIRLDNPPDSSRWYPGAGIYRNVWLTKTAPVHIAHWGTYITTPDVTGTSAKVHLRGTVQNQDGKPVTVTISTSIHELDANDEHGPAVASLPSVSMPLASGQSQTFEMERPLDHPKLWSTEHPERYVAITEVSEGTQVVDRYETPFGIRSIRFDPAQGFLLNGRRVALQGVCGHHDLGALGAAFHVRAAQRQLEILKEMGVNALRTSHNMPAPELLDLCDKMGILVMDESFDCWELQKKPNDYHLLFDDWHERDLRAEYRRDRNHPCVIMWSLGNEIRGQGDPKYAPLFHELVGIAHDEDPTRPSTLGANHIERFDPVFTKEFDLAGENYDPGMYAAFHASHPAMPLFASETASACSSRGVYFFPPKNALGNFQVSSYDQYVPGWANQVDSEFSALQQNQYVAGEFVWTGFDYLGEPTPYNKDMTNLLNFQNDPARQAEMAEQLKAMGKIKTPSRSSYFGIVDLCGFKKDRFYLYQAHWRPDFPMVHILPHWNWPGREGQTTPVFVYSSGDEVELFLNGKSWGRKKLQPLEYRFIWDDVTYMPGELKAVAYKNGKPWAETTVRTTGAAAAVALEADRPAIRGDGLDLCYITARVADRDGLTVPVAQNKISFSVASGPGEIVAADNGDPTDLQTFSEPSRHAFNGMALVIVRVKPGQRGDIRINASSEGLNSGSCVIHAE